MLKLILLILIPIFFTNLSIANEIIINGSTAVNANIFEPYKEEIEKRTKLKLNIVPTNSLDGMTLMKNNEVDIAMISSHIPLLIPEVKINDSIFNYKGVLIAKSNIAFIANNSNYTFALHEDQLHDILTGRLTNWKEVGGPDQNIMIVVEKNGGLKKHIEKTFIGSIIKGNIKTVENGTLVAEVVEHNENALGLINMKLVNSNVKLLSTDRKFEQNLYLVAKKQHQKTLEKISDVIKKMPID